MLSKSARPRNTNIIWYLFCLTGITTTEKFTSTMSPMQKIIGLVVDILYVMCLDIVHTLRQATYFLSALNLKYSTWLSAVCMSPDASANAASV